MKPNYIILVTVILLTVLNNSAISQSNPPDKAIINKSKKIKQSKEQGLGHQVFNAFQRKNDLIWIALYPTNAEFRELTMLMSDAKIEKLPQSKVDEMLAQHDKEATTYYKNEFQSFLRQTDSLGINWNDAVFQKFDFDSEFSEKFSRKYLNGDLWFSCRKAHFVIEGIEAVETPSGYKLQSIKGIRQVDDGE